MAGTTITGLSTVGLTLTSVTQNPVFVVPDGGIVTADDTVALSGGDGVSVWTIDNNGTLQSTHPRTFYRGVYATG